MIHGDKVDLIYSRNVINASKELLYSSGNSFLIVTGKSSARLSGALNDVLEAISDKECIIYDGIRENPEVSSILEAARLLDDVDCVIGIGGGSVMDAAKVIACLKNNKAESEEELYAQKWENAALPLFLIGTTAGTGSEVTKVAVLTKANGRKASIHNDRFYASYALCDPVYTYSQPKAIAIATAVDALTHCNESYFSNKANDLSRAYALKGISYLLPGLKVIKDQISDELKDNLYLGSLYGGLAIDIAGTTFAHNVSYYLTENFHIPHGFACAVFQEDLFDFEMKNNKQYTDEFFSQINMDKESYIELISSLIPTFNIALSEQAIKEILPRYENNNSVKNTYGQMNVSDIERILKKKFNNQSFI